MRMKRLTATLVPLLALAICQPAAAAPQPRAPFDRAHMKGRWYEIARTPNRVNRDCQGSATDWQPKPDGSFRITAICRKGSPTGPAKTVTGDVEVLNPGQNNRVKMKLLAGLVSREYWIFDHAADYAWLIMGTPKGDFVSISATRPILPEPVKAEALARARALGFDTSRLAFPMQLGSAR